MLTVIDPLVFINQQNRQMPGAIPLVIIIRGDEQLALAADGYEDALSINEISSTGLSANSGDVDSAICGSIYRDGREIFVLDARKLFSAAMGKLDRRRRRT